MHTGGNYPQVTKSIPVTPRTTPSPNPNGIHSQTNSATTIWAPDRDALTLTDINSIVSGIFAGKSIPELKAIESQAHPSGKSNLDFHTSQIQEQINKVCSSQCEKLDYMINRISLSKYNKVNIDVHIQKSGDKIQFYLSGPDLRNYFMYLPVIGHYPHTGTSHSKWYGLECKARIETIALNLKLLEIMLFRVNISETYTVSSTGTGILGAEVAFTIPSKYESDADIISKANKSCSSNPIKVSDGLFLYGKNGVNSENTTKLLDALRSRFEHIESQVFPRVITDWDLTEFVSSSYRFALCSWNRHARILVKSCKKLDVMIIDPWMDGLPRVIRAQLVPANPNIRIGFLSRTVKDQKGEGSCVFCAMARLISLVDMSESTSPDIASGKPIDDFYAYLVKSIYKKV